MPAPGEPRARGFTPGPASIMMMTILTAPGPSAHLWRLLTRLAAHLLPRACLLCGSACDDQPLCPFCQNALPGQHAVRCRRCARPLASHDTSQTATTPRCCTACRQRPSVLSASYALADYRPPLDHVLTALKFGQQPHLANPLGRLLMAHCLAHPDAPLQQVDALIPLPMSGPRLAERGFNQTLLLARALRAHAPRDCPPLLTDCLQRRRHTPHQSGLTRHQRLQNLQNAFSVVRPDAVAGRRLALLDDVMTTGATLETAARTLLDTGASTVIALVVARTP